MPRQVGGIQDHHLNANSARVNELLHLEEVNIWGIQIDNHSRTAAKDVPTAMAILAASSVVLMCDDELQGEKARRYCKCVCVLKLYERKNACCCYHWLVRGGVHCTWPENVPGRCLGQRAFARCQTNVASPQAQSLYQPRQRRALLPPRGS
eukprot:6482188-Amphidinium_carterae.1